MAAWVASCGVEGNENETQEIETQMSENQSVSQSEQKKQSGESGFYVTGDGYGSQSGSGSYGGIYYHPSYVDACKKAGYVPTGDGIIITKPMGPTLQPSDSGVSVFWYCYHYLQGFE